MPRDPYYNTKEWQALRIQAIARDGGMCTVPGCRSVAKVVDHVKSRASGGADTLANVRSLCRLHDNQVKEGRDGIRRMGGKARVVGCDKDGWPLDPEHDWNKP